MSKLSDVLAAFADEVPSMVQIPAIDGPAADSPGLDSSARSSFTVHATTQGGCCIFEGLPFCPESLFPVLLRHGSLLERRGELSSRGLVGNSAASYAPEQPPSSILAEPRPDPFADFPHPSSVLPRRGPPNYCIPATDDGNFPIKAPLTDAEKSLDGKQVADACARAVDGLFTPWAEFTKRRA